MTRETRIVIEELIALARRIRTLPATTNTYQVSRMLELRAEELEKTDQPLGSIGPKEMLV